MTDVSVVITTFNDGEFLHRALRSVATQTARPKEVIVVDDGSDTDLAAQIVARLSTPKFSISYIRQENRGPSSARNAGLLAATQEFIAFLDVDDVWISSNLEHKLTLLQGKSGLYMGAYGSFLRDDSNSALRFSQLDGVPSVSSIGRQGGFPGGAPAYLFRRRVLLSVGGFDERLRINEDFDLLLRILRQGYKVVGDSEPGFIRTMRMGSLTRNAKPLVVFERASEFLEKAAKEHYFPSDELDRRWRRARLTMVRRLVASGAGLAATASIVRRTFSNPAPTSLIERTLLTASRFISALGVRERLP
jgi:glycosyltransferase involved in cell wall biosynthesis